MLRKKQDEITWLEFELLSGIKGLSHGIFLRHGGVSGPPYYSLNMGFSSGDEKKAVSHNRNKALEILNIPSIYPVKTNHTNCVKQINSSTVIEGFCDGLITQEKGLGLLMTHADCQAAIFYDPRHHAVANVHCGWRGNVQNIYRETILAMKEKIGSDPKELIVCVSPSLGPQYAEFKNYRIELPESFWSYQIKPTYFDLWAIARAQLENEGIKSQNIEIASLCTFENKEDFFSYRRDKLTGRNATIVSLTK